MCTQGIKIINTPLGCLWLGFTCKKRLMYYICINIDKIVGLVEFRRVVSFYVFKYNTTLELLKIYIWVQELDLNVVVHHLQQWQRLTTRVLSIIIGVVNNICSQNFWFKRTSNDVYIIIIYGPRLREFMVRPCRYYNSCRWHFA